jgi:predicted transcriptional regulator of viral defense system
MSPVRLDRPQMLLRYLPMAGREEANSDLQTAHVRLSRTALLAGRAGIVVLDDDMAHLDEVTGSRSRSHAVLERLERVGRIRRVRRGVYALVDATGGVRVGILDLIAALTPGPYLVTGGRALQFHGLTDQHFRRVHVLAASQMRPWSWRGDEVRYVRTEAPLRGGAARSRKTPARIATPARALADSLSHPRWGVTMSQVVEALDAMLARDPDFADVLAAEVARQDNHALARRLGFLVTHVAGTHAARPFLALLGDSKASTPLQPGAGAVGPIDSRWQVRVNVDLERLLQHREVG